MIQKINTDVCRKYFRNDGCATNIAEVYKEEDAKDAKNPDKYMYTYVYKILNKKDPYILKGYKIYYPMLKYGKQSSKDSFEEIYDGIIQIHQEYFLSKLEAELSPHIAKSLEIGRSFVWGKNKNESNIFYIEILIEYGGETIFSKDSAYYNLTLGYEWMRQSAKALRLFQYIGQSHLDIKPGNMVYNNDCLKIIDFGSVYDNSGRGGSTKETESITSKVNEWTKEYAPPEIQKYDHSHASIRDAKYELDKIDAYLWAMSFFSGFTNREAKQLNKDVKNYKLKTKELYAEYISDIVIPELKKLAFKNQDEEKIKKFIIGILVKELSFDYKERMGMDEVFNAMKKFEAENNMNIKEISNENEIEVVKIPMLKAADDGATINSNISISAVCKDCEERNNIKAELECGHRICEGCLMKYMIEKFKAGQPYDHCARCNFCSKESKLGI